MAIDKWNELIEKEEQNNRMSIRIVNPINEKNTVSISKCETVNMEFYKTVEKFNEGDKITFSTNFDDDCGGFKVSIIDKYRQDNNMEGSIVYKTFVASRKNATSPWTVTFYQPLSFMKGHTYIVQMEGHEAADDESFAAPSCTSERYLGCCCHRRVRFPNRTRF